MQEHDLLKRKTTGVDSILLEASAAMKSIVRKDTGEDRVAYVHSLACAEGFEINNDNDLRNSDWRRKGKKVSSKEWGNLSVLDARVMKMKKGNTHRACKQKHVLELATEAILSADVQHGNESDANTLLDSIGTARRNRRQTPSNADIKEVVADKGYHK